MKCLPGRAHSAVYCISGILAVFAATGVEAKDITASNDPLTVLPQGQPANAAAHDDAPAPVGHGPAYALEDLRQVFGNVSFSSGPQQGKAVARPATSPLASDEIFTVMLRARFSIQGARPPVSVDRPQQFHGALVQFRQADRAGRHLTYGDLVTRR